MATKKHCLICQEYGENPQDNTAEAKPIRPLMFLVLFFCIGMVFGEKIANHKNSLTAKTNAADTDGLQDTLDSIGCQEVDIDFEGSDLWMTKQRPFGVPRWQDCGMSLFVVLYPTNISKYPIRKRQTCSRSTFSRENVSGD